MNEVDETLQKRHLKNCLYLFYLGSKRVELAPKWRNRFLLDVSSIN